MTSPLEDKTLKSLNTTTTRTPKKYDEMKSKIQQLKEQHYNTMPVNKLSNKSMRSLLLITLILVPIFMFQY